MDIQVPEGSAKGVAEDRCREGGGVCFAEVLEVGVANALAETRVPEERKEEVVEAPEDFDADEGRVSSTECCDVDLADLEWDVEVELEPALTDCHVPWTLKEE